MSTRFLLKLFRSSKTTKRLGRLKVRRMARDKSRIEFMQSQIEGLGRFNAIGGLN